MSGLRLSSTALGEKYSIAAPVIADQTRARWAITSTRGWESVH